jgi:hypothetical protein
VWRGGAAGLGVQEEEERERGSTSSPCLRLAFDPPRLPPVPRLVQIVNDSDSLVSRKTFHFIIYWRRAWRGRPALGRLSGPPRPPAQCADAGWLHNRRRTGARRSCQHFSLPLPSLHPPSPLLLPALLSDHRLLAQHKHFGEVQRLKSMQAQHYASTASTARCKHSKSMHAQHGQSPRPANSQRGGCSRQKETCPQDRKRPARAAQTAQPKCCKEG